MPRARPPAILSALALVVAACGTPGNVSNGAGVSSSLTGSGVPVLPPSAAGSSPLRTPRAAGVALFVYEEGGDKVELIPPATTRTTRKSGAVCENELPENGNMYSGKEVESAFASPDVQRALGAHQTYPSETEGRLEAPGFAGSITWATTCRACLPAPEGVKHLRGVLEVLMRNRRALCP